MLGDRRDSEVSKNKNENKNVIDAEGVLNEIASEKIQGAIWPLHFRNDQAEAERQQDPKHAASRCCAHRQRAMPPLEARQIKRDGYEDANMKGDPKPNACRHGGNRFTLEQRWQREFPSTIAGQL